uniref:Tyrosinase copper-binding domain-containing protein n=2 Tax=Acrobeloides nanus TaxID=290746 RepID=A0A914C4J4_9BILA
MLINAKLWSAYVHILRKAIRKEYRLLTDEERHRYHKALRTLMDNGIFDEISVIHVHVAQDDLVHGKPKFWMWHRGYLKRFEIELRKLDIDLAIPYWDTTLDDNLPFPADSLMWTNDFMGAVDENGTVISGPGANWLTLNVTFSLITLIKKLLNENDIKMLLKMTQVNVPRMKHDRFKYKFSCAQQLNFLELMHASAHHFIGGDMSDLQAASNDPIFLQFHCFIDLIWEIFRQQKDTDCHIRGLIDNDIDETFSYESRPSCTYENPDCSSKYLFCDQHGSEAKCASKIRLNGNCTGLNNEDVPCLEGKCIHDKCLLLNNQTSSLLEDFKLLDFAIHLKRDMGDSMVLDEK